MTPGPFGRMTIEVAAGVIFRNQKLLITQRHAGAHLGGLWEFPGGKRESGETFEQCLARELCEELGIEVEIGPLLVELAHEYPAKHVLLKFFHCRWLRHEPQPLGCSALKWIGRQELDQFSFPEADARILERIRTDSRLWD